MKEGKFILDKGSGYRLYQCPYCKRIQWAQPNWIRTKKCKECGKRFKFGLPHFCIPKLKALPVLPPHPEGWYLIMEGESTPLGKSHDRVLINYGPGKPNTEEVEKDIERYKETKWW